MKKEVAGVMAVSAAVLFTGCGPYTIMKTQDMRALQDSLSVRITAAQQKVLDEQRTQDELLRLIRADLGVHFTEIAKKVGDLDSRLSESQYRLSKIDEKTADFQKRLDAKLSADSAAILSKNAEIDKLFQIATGDFTSGRFEIAQSGFRDLMVRFAGSPKGQESEYWVAECSYAKKEFADAENGYLLYVKDYPQGTKVCAALYKLGLCYEKSGKVKSKDLVWKKLLEQCPGAEEAGLVKTQVK